MTILQSVTIQTSIGNANTNQNISITQVVPTVITNQIVHSNNELNKIAKAIKITNPIITSNGVSFDIEIDL